MLLWLLMVVIGTFIRGPGWMWFWPGQTWDPNRLVFEVNRDLDIFGINSAWLAHLMPEANRDYAPILGKLIFGVVVMGIYFFLAGGIIHMIT